MAGDWIKMRGNLWDDPRVARLCDLTNQGEAAIVGALYWLWATADQHTEDGFMPGLTLRQIDRKTGIQGFGQSLVSIGWLSASDDGVTIRHFDEHNGASAKKRATTAKRVARSRANADETHANTQDNTCVTQAALHAEDAGVTGALAREREEKSNSVPIGTGSASAPPPAVQPHIPAPAIPPVVEPSEVIFGLGVPMLTEANVTDRNARSMLGLMRKQHGDTAVIDALRRCADEKPLAPVAWLQAALKARPQANKREAVENDNRSIADRFIAQRVTPGGAQ